MKRHQERYLSKKSLLNGVHKHMVIRFLFTADKKITCEHCAVANRFKGTVQRKVRCVESGVNRWLVLQYLGA